MVLKGKSFRLAMVNTGKIGKDRDVWKQKFSDPPLLRCCVLFRLLWRIRVKDSGKKDIFRKKFDKTILSCILTAKSDNVG